MSRVYFVSKAAQVELKVDECKPLVHGAALRGEPADGAGAADGGRGLHSSTFQINLSRF